MGLMTLQRKGVFAAASIAVLTVSCVAPFWAMHEEGSGHVAMYPDWPFVTSSCPNVTQEVCSELARRYFRPPTCDDGEEPTICCRDDSRCLWEGPASDARADDRYIQWKDGQCQWFEDIGDLAGCFQHSPLLWPRVATTQAGALVVAILFGLVLLPSDEELGPSLMPPLGVDAPESEFRRRVEHGAIDKVATAKFGAARTYGMLYRLLQVLSLSISFPIGFWFLKPPAAALLACVTRVAPLVAADGFKALWEPTNLVASLRIRPHTLVHGTRIDRALGLWMALEPIVYMSLAVVISDGTESDLANFKAKETWERMLGERGQGFLLMIIMPLCALWPALAFLSFTLYLLMGPSSLAAYCALLGVLGGADSFARSHVGTEVPAQIHSHLPADAASLCGLSAAFALSAALLGVLLARQVIANLPERREDLASLERTIEDAAIARLLHSVKARALADQCREAVTALSEDSWAGRPTFPEGFKEDTLISAPFPESCVKRLAPNLSYSFGFSGGLLLPLVLMALDVLTDISASLRLISRGHYWFGGILAAISYSSLVSQCAKGLITAVPTALRESVAAGVPTRSYISLIESESGFEAIPGFLVQVYSLPWSGVDTAAGVASAALSLVLSMYSITSAVVTLVDFEVDALFEQPDASPKAGDDREGADETCKLVRVQRTCC